MDKDVGDLSDVTVSSIHTSDISSFEDMSSDSDDAVEPAANDDQGQDEASLNKGKIVLLKCFQKMFFCWLLTPSSFFFLLSPNVSRWPTHVTIYIIYNLLMLLPCPPHNSSNIPGVNARDIPGWKEESQRSRPLMSFSALWHNFSRWGRAFFHLACFLFFRLVHGGLNLSASFL